MTTAEFVAEKAVNARAVTFQYGYLVDSRGDKHSFPCGRILQERRRGGRVSWNQTRFPDGSVLEFRWSSDLGPRYKALAPV